MGARFGIENDYRITGLSENMGRDDAIEESYWGTFRESTPQLP